jgi:putative chitinase
VDVVNLAKGCRLLWGDLNQALAQGRIIPNLLNTWGFFVITLTDQILADACHIQPALAAPWVAPLMTAMAHFDINTPTRAAPFLANLAHESQRFSRGRENLNYTTPERLLKIFGRRIRRSEVQQFLRHPEKLANRVYANREGNGNEASGDGWRYRGGGPMGLTFRNNYLKCEKATGLPLVQQPELIEEPEAGAMAGAWFWGANCLNQVADQGNFDAICDIINLGHRTKAVGDSHGYEDRLALYKSAKAALGL